MSGGPLAVDAYLDHLRVERAPGAGGELGEPAKIARVAFERIVGQTALDTKMVEVSVDHVRLC